jgi:Zn-dependent protease with chaperone function
MNFFEQQDRARRKTTRLVVFFVLAVIAIVIAVDLATYVIVSIYAQSRPSRPGVVEPIDMPSVLLGSTCVTFLIIVGGSAYKTMQLSGGGGSVAQLLGGRVLAAGTASNQEAMLQNVVEEMSIASGVPVPQVYVLDHEEGINAFAAGFTTSDAVIGVTRGALEKLNRDELQGVIGHEFSHILNGDMRLNLRLIGLLNGILVVSLIGLALLRAIQFMPLSRGGGRRRDEDDRAVGLLMLLVFLGGALYVIGSIGVLFGRMIQAAVSRQREYLADASAVQFTRNPAGLVGALKKLGGYSSGSKVQSPHALETAHLFFANSGGFSFANLLATHPPLADRIRAIDPTFDGQFSPVSEPSHLMEQYDGHVVPLAGSQQQQQHRVPLTAQQFVDAAGQVAPQHLIFASGLISSIPEALSTAARSAFSARAVVFALLASDEPQVRQKQFSLVEHNVEPECLAQTLDLSRTVSQLGEGARLPLLDLTLPALRQLSPAQAARFRAVVRAMIEADGRVTLFEFALHRLIEKQLVPPDQSRREPMEFYAINAVRDEAAVLLSALASASSAQTDIAFEAGARQLDAQRPPTMVAVPGLGAIDAALRKLARSSPPVKKRLIDAAAATVAADGEVNVAEAELLRATAAALDVPVPPLLMTSTE